MIRFRFDGGSDLARELEALPQRASKRLQREALREGAEPMRSAMGRLAPRRPPHPDMADHIVISNARGVDSQEIAIAVGPEKRFFYGSFQEFGTSRHGAQPFARPAFDETIMKSLSIISAALWRELAARGVHRSMADAVVPVVGGHGSASRGLL